MTDELSTETVVVADGDFLTTELDDEMVILDGDSSAYYGLNEVGRRIWEQIQDPQSIAEIRDRIVAEYDVEPDRCERDLYDVVADLSSNGLVEISNE
ncbi:PqqD family protein [Halomontanus rarus]|uniref:PqqD family protein n=1 Tax=Halomontanus rarus TaxID=3034020 RepID=UPI0023E8850E|nr:PqqD family protein [Halovivax sp. TS33]